jgi:hypothetical protein
MEKEHLIFGYSIYLSGFIALSIAISLEFKTI